MFAELPYEQVTIRGICAASAVNVAMVNYYFGSKAKLYESVAQHSYELLDNALRQILAANSQPRERLLALSDFIAGGKSKIFYAIALILAREIREPGRFHPAYRKMLVYFFEFIDQIFIDGIASGDFRSDISYKEMTRCYRSQLFFQLVRGTKTDDVLEAIEDYQSHVETQLKILCQGIINSGKDC